MGNTVVRISDLSEEACVDPRRSFVRLLRPFRYQGTASARAEELFSGRWTPDAAVEEAELLDRGRSYLRSGSVLGVLDDNRGLRSYDMVGAHGDWRIVLEQRARAAERASEFGISVDLSDVGFALFPTGVGVLSITIRPKTADLAAWANALHAMRLTDGQRSSFAIRRSTGAGTWRGWSPITGSVEAEWGVMTVDQLTTMLLGEGWWEPANATGRALTYSALFVDGVAPESQRLLRYALANNFHADQLLDPEEESYGTWMAYNRRAGFATTIEGSVFLACDLPATAFFDDELPTYIEREYGLVYLLAVHQRSALLRLLEDAADASGSRDRLRQARRFTEFAAARHSLQAIQRENHYRYSLSCIAAAGIDDLFSGVEAVMVGFRAEAEQRLQNTVVFALAIPSIVLGFLGISIAGVTTGDGLPLVWSLVALAAAILALGAAVRGLRH
jgi:hypothetical protein